MIPIPTIIKLCVRKRLLRHTFQLHEYRLLLFKSFYYKSADHIQKNCSKISFLLIFSTLESKNIRCTVLLSFFLRFSQLNITKLFRTRRPYKCKRKLIKETIPSNKSPQHTFIRPFIIAPNSLRMAMSFQSFQFHGISSALLSKERIAESTLGTSIFEEI